MEAARALASIDSDVGRCFQDVHVGRTTAHSVTPLMYDHIAILAFLEPDVVRRSEEMFLDVEVDHGALCGAPLYRDSERRPPVPVEAIEHVRKATVLRDLDTPRFLEVFLDLMKKPLDVSRSRRLSCVRFPAPCSFPNPPVSLSCS